MSKIGKRRTNQLDGDPPKTVKKYKKTPDRENVKANVGKSSGYSGFQTPDSSLNEIKEHRRKRASPQKRAKTETKSNESIVNHEAQDVKSLNISQLLDLGEGKNCETQIFSVTGETSDSDGEDWEEVKMEEHIELRDPVIPKEGVNITLEVPGMNALKRKKKGFDLEAHIRRQMNQVKRELQVLIHKVHVLCWFAHLKFVNTILNSETLMGMGLSLVSSKNLYPPKYADLGYLERIVKWFHSVIELKEFLKNPVRNEELVEQLCHEFGIKKAYNKKHYVLMMIILFRTLGLKTRLVMSFQVVPIRPKNIELSSKSNQDDGTKKESKGKTIEGEVKIIKVENDYFKNKDSQDSESSFLKKNNDTCDINHTSTSKKGENKGKSLLKKNGIMRKDNKNLVNKGKVVSQDSDSDNSETSKHFKCSPVIEKKKRIATQKCGSGFQVVKKSRERKTSLEETPKMKGKLPVSKVKERKGKSLAKNSGGEPSVKRKRARKPTATPEMKNKVIEKASRSSDTDSDFVPQSLKKKTGESEIDRRVFSSDDEEETIKKQGMDIWAEVFLEAEEKWITVDVIRQKIHCVNELYSRATQPVVYVVACNNDSTLKDVTKRYVPNWHSDTRKRRVDEAWWNETMWPYIGPKTAQDREEDEDINKQLLDKPLPAVISEYKDHPLYALKRHLLKFEGIYPPEAPTLGFVRGEPVYARECVVTLRSREVWYKEARMVRLGEQPYKIVKARPKYDKMTGEIRKDLPLELFGFWQTEEYIPPIAIDGKVPRNEYGNVDLFKPCMLPKGTVHLQIPALNKIAKKLGIDCAAAVVGFEFHSGASHPLTDGFVVCEEFKDFLLDAWNKEVDESNRKNEEKRLKRIYGNWKRLIRGLLIREKLKIKYDFGGEKCDPESSKPGKSDICSQKKTK